MCQALLKAFCALALLLSHFTDEENEAQSGEEIAQEYTSGNVYVKVYTVPYPQF